MQNTFSTIARYTYSSEAEIIKGRLEAEGIKVFLKDNITIDTDPLVSNAIGGIKLNVLAEDEAKAKDILKSISSYALDDNGNTIICSNCGSGNVSLYSTINSFKSFFHFIIGILFGTLPFSARYEYKCEDCNTVVDVKD
ncbi:MAG: hypothetical protein CMC76_05640 [Flavobacteriaceae bacterium]|uniref:putative signal transducing protein n=1 Tax=Winogradskyella sp. SYSU M77433 TaxID=3042722 RepID=UPI000C42CCFA|nr:DUF2007 domain-containing protein [Winogradskyella sp. SYSU M77433]MAX70571.1 hypothetical protein [Flavobacteriaceae bacterium]MDH7912259.1 DUF2007 domain-containing protein [Winogradskyella sp. SYSU M77433]|tara:strand:+ start:2285 stop:2701 length:417 start_codon:yes stop_codon:yes gene_type:complete